MVSPTTAEQRGMVYLHHLSAEWHGIAPAPQREAWSISSAEWHGIAPAPQREAWSPSGTRKGWFCSIEPMSPSGRLVMGMVPKEPI